MPNLHTPVLISHLTAREILDSRGFPTVECTCHLSDGRATSSSVPSGASTGSNEALELRDGDTARYHGQGVLKAISHLESPISGLVTGEDPCNQAVLDKIIIEADGTSNKQKFGANAILAASNAICKAGAVKKRVQIFQHIAEISSNDKPLDIPVPMFNIMNGGAHANMAVDFQEFMVVPNATHIPAYADQLETCASLTHALKKVLQSHGLSTAVGDEGGFAPHLDKNTEAIDLVAEATQAINRQFGQDIQLGIDCAANTYFSNDKYKIRDASKPMNLSNYSDYLLALINKYQLYTIEDGFPESEWPAWQNFMKMVHGTATLIGDDLIVTNQKWLEKAIETQACDGIIIKPNQIGTVSEAIDVVNLAKSHNFKIIVSHRSGETTDSFIADFSVGVGSEHVKFGAPVRGERVCKYNRLLRINDILNAS
jgi:enolase